VTLEVIFGIALAAAIAISLAAKFLPKRRPAEKFFKCARCNAVSPHNNRTIEAWRNNKIRFFCQACHAKWLQSHPLQLQRREHLSQRGLASGSSGCLVVALLAPVSLGLLLAWAYA
jgi:uncharacterized protein YlaI